MNLSTLASQSSQLVNELQYSSQILKCFCDFSLFPNVDLGITVVSVLQNTRGSTLGKERDTFEWEQRWEEWMCKIFQKIQEKQVLFQQFVMSIVASKSSSLSATQSVSQLVIEPVSQSIGQ